MRGVPRAEIVLPVTIVLAAVALGASEFMTTFEFTPPGGEPLGESLASDRHSYALLLLATFAVASMLLAIATGVRTYALATAGFGVAALLIFLILDLPDAGKLGTLGGDSEFTFSTAEAEPQTGFVLEAVGAVVLALAAVALTTLGATQLQAPLARLRAGREREPGAEQEPAPATAPKPATAVTPAPERAEQPAQGATPSGRVARDYAPFDFEGRRSDEGARAMEERKPSASTRRTRRRGGLLGRLRGTGR